MLIEKINNVSINQKGNKIKITGSKNSINDTHYILINLYESIKKGEEVDEEKIKDMKSVISLKFNHENTQQDLFIETKKRKYMLGQKIKKIILLHWRKKKLFLL